MFPESTVSGARTVIDITEHFEHLKHHAALLFEKGSAGKRGYFTPSEDQNVRQLLVSYWHSRNALIELVVTMHRTSEHQTSELTETNETLSRQQRAAAFLVAWTGALVLVDAARFLRDNCRNRPAVLKKLNEPEPSFGIAAGTYDRIQDSLTSPVHVWHLYHAREYWKTNKSALAEMAHDTELEPLVELSDRMQAVLDVDIQEYAVSRLRTRARQAKTTGRELIARAFFGLQKAVSSLVSGKYTHLGHQPRLPPDIVKQIRQLIQPGDIFVNRKEYAVTNYFLPGFWPHAAFYIGQTHQLDQLGFASHPHGEPRWQRILTCDQSDSGRVVEALKDGVRIRSLSSPFAADAVTVIRPSLPNDLITEAIARALFHDGKPYDFDFDLTRSDRLVCTEVVYRSFEGLAGIRFPLMRRAGRLTLAAQDLLQMALNRQHFDIVAVYAPNYVPDVTTGSAAADVLQATLTD
ncbi:MAG: hypothetical protein MK110_07705 [Fuerstiella sp.]|nr:hypothetical protein [Fuerstiella sp.]